MMVYRTKYLALIRANSDETVVRVEDGYMIVPRGKHRKWKSRKVW